MDILRWFSGIYFPQIFNLGLYLGLVMGVLILLRPVLCRLLTPGQRTFLWGTAWVVGFFTVISPGLLGILSEIPLPSRRKIWYSRVPISFGSLLLVWEVSIL